MWQNINYYKRCWIRINSSFLNSRVAIIKIGSWYKIRFWYLGLQIILELRQFERMLQTKRKSGYKNQFSSFWYKTPTNTCMHSFREETTSETLVFHSSFSSVMRYRNYMFPRISLWKRAWLPVLLAGIGYERRAIHVLRSPDDLILILHK